MTARHRLADREARAGGRGAFGRPLAAAWAVGLAWAGLGAVPAGATPVAPRSAAAPASSRSAAVPASPGSAAAGASLAACLPQRQVDLVKLVAEQSVIPPGSAATFGTVSRGSPR